MSTDVNGEVVKLALINGLTVMAKVVDQQEDGFVVSKPMSVQMRQVTQADGNGRARFEVSLVPWFDEVECNIYYQAIMAEARPNDELLRAYLTQTTGLDLSTMGNNISPLRPR